MKPIYQELFVNDDGNWIFDQLLKLNWLEYTDARKEYFMADRLLSYTYGQGRGVRTYETKPFIPEVKSIMTVLNMKHNSEYDLCFLNRYDKQSSQLGWHSDDAFNMDGNHPIGVISFGAEREIWWRKIGDKGIVPVDNRQKLGNGSLWIMPSGFQSIYQHRIPRCQSNCGIRISLTFRKYKESPPE